MTAPPEPSGSAPSPAESAAEATLELTILSVDGHSSSSSSASFLHKPSPSISAWVNPAHKRCTRSLTRTTVIHLPLSLLSIQNPSSSLTIKILHHRLPFQSARPYASAAVPLSSLPLAGGRLALQLRRPSGRVTGSIQFSFRLLWSLNSEQDRDEFNTFRLEPSAPPLPLLAETEQPKGKTPLNNMEWKSFVVGMFSGAMAVVLVAALKPH